MTTQPTNSQPTEQAILPERLVRMQIKYAITGLLDHLADDASKVVGDVLKNTPPRDRLSDTQINGLVSLVNSVNTVAEVQRYIQRQASRRPSWNINDLSGKLLGNMKDNLKNQESGIIEKIKRVRSIDEGQVEQILSQQKPDIHFLLVREFIQFFAVGYRYQVEKQRPAGGRRNDSA